MKSNRRHKILLHGGVIVRRPRTQGLTGSIVLMLSAVFLYGAAPAWGATGSYQLQHYAPSLSNLSSLQRGAKYFVNYCMGCHSANYSRYNRLAADLGLTEDMVADNLLFTGDRIGNNMTIAMRSEDAQDWFNAIPPDLTLVARSRGVDWVYTYLKSFYLDDTRPSGVNNALFQHTAMPHVLWSLQGWQAAVFDPGRSGNGPAHHAIKSLELQTPGLLSEEQYDKAVGDITNFLYYLSEPIRLHRHWVGIGVLLFLLVFAIIAYFLKREYWKDIH